VKGLNKQAALTSCADALRKATDSVHLDGYEKNGTVAKESRENRWCGERERGRREKRKRRGREEKLGKATRARQSCISSLGISIKLGCLIGLSRVFWLPYACVLRPEINCTSTTIGTTKPLLIGIALLYVIDIIVAPLIIETDERICLAVNSQRPASHAIVGCY
jgi:hypothetical protein